MQRVLELRQRPRTQQMDQLGGGVIRPAFLVFALQKVPAFQRLLTDGKLPLPLIRRRGLPLGSLLRQPFGNNTVYIFLREHLLAAMSPLASGVELVDCSPVFVFLVSSLMKKSSA